MQGVGHATMNRGDRTSKDVIISMKNPQSLDREHIEIVLYHTEDILVSGFISTDRANGSIAIRESETILAVMNIGLELLELPREILDIGTIRFQQKKREFYRGLFADSWHIGYKVDETLEGFWHYLLNVKCESLRTRYPGLSTLSIFSIMLLEVRVSRDSASAIRIFNRFSSKVRFLRVISRLRMLYPLVALTLRTQT